MSKFLDLNGLTYFNGKLNEKLVLVADENTLPTASQPNSGNALTVTVTYLDSNLPVAYYHTTAPLSSGCILQWAGGTNSIFNTTVTTVVEDGYYLETISCTYSGFTMSVSRRSALPGDNTVFEIYGYSYSTSGSKPAAYSSNTLMGSGFLYRPGDDEVFGDASEFDNAVICGFNVCGNSPYYLQANTSGCTPQLKPCTVDPEISGGLITPPMAMFPGDATLYKEVIED